MCDTFIILTKLFHHIGLDWSKFGLDLTETKNDVLVEGLVWSLSHIIRLHIMETVCVITFNSRYD